jgi:aspartate kinase/aspartokinase/homoserine dehydrogenase 1
MTTKTKSKKIVVKFGGSNLKRTEDISALLRVVGLYRQPLVIVISALYGVTDSLVDALHRVTTCENVIAEIGGRLKESHQQVVDLYIEVPQNRAQVSAEILQRVEELEKYLRGINCLGEIPDFTEALVLSCGERLASLVLSAMLKDRNIPCSECLPETLGLFTNGEYRNATVDFSRSGQNVRQGLSGDQIYIVPGFYGISPNSKVTLLGRGGSDYTAAAIARCIDAEAIDLWKDVPGFMSADPKLVDRPKRIRQLSYNEAAELSYFGARIAHPRTFEPAEEKNIPVRLFNINDVRDDLEPLTVVNGNGVVEEDVIKSVTYSDDFGVLKLHGAGVGIKPGIMAQVTTRLARAGINIKSVITSQTCINILLSGIDLDRGLQIVKSLQPAAVDSVSALRDISLIAAVGDGILERPGIAARVLGAVSAHNINVLTISAGASNVAVYFIINRRERETAVRAIHDEFFSNNGSEDSSRLQKEYQYNDYYDHANTLGYVV